VTSHATGTDPVLAWLPASTPGRLAAGYLAGVALARLANLVLPLGVGAFAFTLSVVAFPVLWWTAAKFAVDPEAGAERVRLALAVAAGVAGDELLYLAVRASGVDYWSVPSVASSAVLAGSVLALVVAVDRRAGEGSPPAPGRRFVAFLGGIVGLSLVGYRVSQTYFRLRGVPNEERSLVLYGHEIHHASTGTLLLVVGALVLASRGLDRRVHRLAAVAAAVGLGFVADEYTYLFYRVMTDARYFGDVSLAGGIAATATVIVMLAHHARRARN